MIAAIRGPYGTGASAPAGAVPLVRCPQPHSRSISWCSVTSARTGCRSKTWRRSTAVTGPPASPAPHQPQPPGSWRISRSGLATCASVVPLCPSCPPGLRPLRLRSDRGLGVGLARPTLTRRRPRRIPRVLPQPRLKLSDPLPRPFQLSPRLRKFLAQRFH